MSYSVITTPVKKAKNLLLPLVGITKTHKELKKFQADVFLQWEGMICGIGCLELLVYFREESELFTAFEQTILSNSKLTACYDIKEGGRAYLFDISEHYKTVMKFMEGKYSEFDNKIKDKIRWYWSDSPVQGSKMPQLGHPFKIILYPEYYYESAADELGVSVELLKEGGELMSKVDIEDETFTLTLESELFKVDNDKLGGNRI